MERSADRELQDALLNGEYCYVLNSRQMGKSSLAVRAMGYLAGVGVRTAFVDLTKIGASGVTEEQWYVGVIVELARPLGLRSQAAAHLREHAALSPSQRFVTFLQDVVAVQASPVAVIVDEVDSVRSLTFSTDAFFAGIRQCWNARSMNPVLKGLTFCLMGAALPGDLIRDVRVTPFNVGRRIELKDFSFAEALPLAQALECADGENLLKRVLFWTGGHPYLTQSLCAALTVRRRPTVDFVDELVLQRYLDARARDTDSNLADVGNRLLGRADPDMDERLLSDVLSAYERMLRGKVLVDDEANPAAARIKMSGASRSSGGRLHPRNRIYSTVFSTAWVRENMPGAELRRQRHAFRKGVVRAGAVAGAGVVVVGSLAVAAFRNAQFARESEHKALLAQNEATRFAASERTAKEEAQRSAANARSSLARALSAEASAKVSAQQERASKIVAQRSEAQAVASRLLAVRNEQEARSLLYSSNMQLASNTLDHGNGVQMAEYLGLNGKDASNLAGAGWEKRHLYAVLHEARELRVKGEEVTKLAFTPGGRLISEDITMRLSVWDPITGALLHQMQPTDRPGGIAEDVSAGGKQACLTLANGDIQVLSTETLEPVKTIKGIDSPVEWISLPDAPNLMLGWFGTTRRTVDLVTGKISNPLGYAPDGNYYGYRQPDLLRRGLLLSVDNTTLFAYQVAEDGRPYTLWTNLGRHNTIRSTASSPDGGLLAYADSYGCVQLVDTATGRDKGPALVSGALVQAIAFSGDGSRVATGDWAGVIKVWRVRDGVELRAYRSAYGDIRQLALDQTGDRVAYSARVSTIGLFDATSVAGPRGVFQNDNYGAASLGVSQDGSSITVARTDGHVCVLDAHTGRRLEDIPTDIVQASPVLSPDGKRLACAGLSKVVRIWDRKTLHAHDITFKDSDYRSIAFSPDGRRLAVWTGMVYYTDPFTPSAFSFYDSATGVQLGREVKSTGFVRGVAFSPDGRQFAVAWEGGRIAVFDADNPLHYKDVVRTSGNVQAGDAPWSIAFAPDGKTFLVGGTKGKIEVFDARTAKLEYAWPAHTGRVNAMAFADGTHTLLSISDDRRLSMWSFGSWRSVGEITFPESLYSIAFSAKDSAAYVMDFDGNLRALRTRGTRQQKPTNVPEYPTVSWDSELAEAKRRHRAILFPTFYGFLAYDRALRSLLLNNETYAILARRFAVFAPWQGSSITFKGKSTAIETVYAKLFGPDKTSPSIKILGGDGKVRFDGTWVKNGKKQPMRMPQEPAAIEAFLAVLRANAPDMTASEIGRLRDFLRASAKPYLEGQELSAKYQKMVKAYNADRQKLSPEEGLARIDALWKLLPYDRAYLDDRAKYLARLGRWQQAADAFGAIFGDAFGAYFGEAQRIPASHTSQRAMAAILAGDRKTYASLADCVDEYYDGNDQVLRTQMLALNPDPNIDFKKSLESVRRLAAADLKSKSSPYFDMLYALLEARAGELSDSERWAREALAKKWNNLPDREVGRAILAVVFAKKGDRVGALKQFDVAEAAFGRRAKDGDLIAGDQMVGKQGPSPWWGAMYPVLRKELTRITNGQYVGVGPASQTGSR